MVDLVRNLSVSELRFRRNDRYRLRIQGAPIAFLENL